MSVIALGLNHQTAPLDLRGRFALSPERMAPTLHAVRERLRLPSEVALVSTCNRTELYVGAEAGSAESLVGPAVDWFAGMGQIGASTLREHAYVLQGGAAARHAFRVASGLDSMVLGEPQILGQMKQAVREADQAGTLGTTLHQMFQRSFAVAKEVRSSTEIGNHSISMAAAIVRLAAQLFEDLGELKVLFVGAGEMIELVCTHFSARAPRQVVVANRTVERGERLARRFGGEAMRLSDLPQRLSEFDVVVSCTASSVPIVGLGAVERALKARRHRPMFMVDLAVPRDIEPEVARLSDVYLYTVDDLSTLVQSAGAKRQAAVAQAEAIIETGVQGFVSWLGQRDTVPLIQALQAQAAQWREAELARARKLLAKGESVDAVLEALSRGLTQKMMHGALVELQSGDGSRREQAADTVTRLFLRDGRDPRGLRH
ncbi:glutamyl-tRNA reductase [Piscinibacter sakaiensis]|uniref:Glutamyl-tRNA reductase n=1 Tax=Piscinibacter sakaiensis TaxID=1547922 RepID=A0A0K8NY57_PISS1|nr:glutamyl-tRNA reductase [Piscinibacter sakaiensis]GAP34865.1 glutamyl-tRNA reductase [Piscinibacter sakaiensis]